MKCKERPEVAAARRAADGMLGFTASERLAYVEGRLAGWRARGRQPCDAVAKALESAARWCDQRKAIALYIEDLTDELRRRAAKARKGA